MLYNLEIANTEYPIIQPCLSVGHYLKMKGSSIKEFTASETIDKLEALEIVKFRIEITSALISIAEKTVKKFFILKQH